MITDLLQRVLSTSPLRRVDARHVFDTLGAPATQDAERAALLMALNVRPRTVEDLTSLAFEMRRRAEPFSPRGREQAIDLCGSGGAPLRSFNVSTVSAFVVAAAGQPVIKHGNRSARGTCGSSDLLNALGLPIFASRAYPKETFRRWRLAFLHAPLYHSVAGAVAGIRKQLGIPTIFNELGPLANPAGVPFQVTGVADASRQRLVAGALQRLGVRRGMVVTSDEGADEFSPKQTSRVLEWGSGRFITHRVKASSLLPPPDRRGSWSSLDPHDAARQTERLFEGERGARRGAALLTSAAALWVGGRSKSLGAGIQIATDALDSGVVASLLGDMQDLARTQSWD